MGSVLGKYRLVPHPNGPQPGLSLGCKISRLGQDVLQFEYVAIGAVERVRWPAHAGPMHIDGLWHATCFEAFLAKPDGSYLELNFATSGAWATYRFEGYRDGMSPAIDLPSPRSFLEQGAERIALTVLYELTGEFASPLRLALAAVIEETDGTKSYWALAHPPGKPDFHHPTCFAATLPAPNAA